MRKFSWYTDSEPHISTYINGALKKRYLVVDGIAVVGRCVMHYKPNLKGGHTHNHIKNMELRLMLSKKEKAEFKLKVKERCAELERKYFR